MTTLLDLTRVFDALAPIQDQGARRRVFEAIDNPSMTAWIAARSVVVAQSAPATLWGAVVAHNPGLPHTERPTAYQILTALEKIAQNTPKKESES